MTEWKNETDAFSWEDQTVIEWDPSTTSRITFKPDPNSFDTPKSTQLQRSTSYKIFLYVTAIIPPGSPYAAFNPYLGMAQRVVTTAPGPPINGAFLISPQNFVFPDHLLIDPLNNFKFDAPQWRADSSLGGSSIADDLKYSFGFTPADQVCVF